MFATCHDKKLGKNPLFLHFHSLFSPFRWASSCPVPLNCFCHWLSVIKSIFFLVFPCLNSHRQSTVLTKSFLKHFGFQDWALFWPSSSPSGYSLLLCGLILCCLAVLGFVKGSESQTLLLLMLHSPSRGPITPDPWLQLLSADRSQICVFPPIPRLLYLAANMASLRGCLKDTPNLTYSKLNHGLPPPTVSSLNLDHEVLALAHVL